MIKKEFPIIEFDPDKNAYIRPSMLLQPMDISERCVLCFFSDAIEKILKEYSHKVVTHLISECIKIPVYEINYNGVDIILLQACVGAPMAAGQIEELTVLGCNKFIACGGCGVLNKDIAVGNLIIPVSAVRDEGTSYHYIEPSREIFANEKVVKVIEDTLSSQYIPYIKAKTWTTDAFFRETPARVELRKSEGCVTVDMEASAFIAVAEYNNVEFGQILYAGDSLAGEEWDYRGWNNREKVRELALRLALDSCLRL